MFNRSVIRATIPLVLVLTLAGSASAQPPWPPMVLDGFVYIDRVKAEDGTLVEARIEGVTVASTRTWTFDGLKGRYVLEVPGNPGDEVHLLVEGTEANESPVEWEMGSKTLDLTVGPPPPTYTLTIVVIGSGRTDPPEGTHAYPERSIVVIRADPDDGWEFRRWDGDVADPDSAVTWVIMDSDKTVTATFGIPSPTPTPTLTPTSGPSSPTPTATPTATNTSPPPTPTATFTSERPTATPTEKLLTDTPTSTRTPVPTSTPMERGYTRVTRTPTHTATPTPVATATLTQTLFLTDTTATPTATRTATISPPEPTETPASLPTTFTSSPTATPSLTATPPASTTMAIPTSTPESATPTPTPSASLQPSEIQGGSEGNLVLLIAIALTGIAGITLGVLLRKLSVKG